MIQFGKEYKFKKRGTMHGSIAQSIYSKVDAGINTAQFSHRCAARKNRNTFSFSSPGIVCRDDFHQQLESKISRYKSV